MSKSAFMADDDECSDTSLRMIFFGTTGVGKSSCCNTVIGENLFVTGNSISSVTRSSKEVTKKVLGRMLTVVDTPGIFDSESTLKDQHTELEKVLKYTSPGPHAFLMVHSLARRFREDDSKVLDQLELFFGPDAPNYTIIIFTGVDQLRGETLESAIKDVELLQNDVMKCGKRFIGFDNHNASSRCGQVFQLFMAINSMLKQRHETYFKNQWFFEHRRIISVHTKHLNKKIYQLEDKLAKEKRKNAQQALSVEIQQLRTKLYEIGEEQRRSKNEMQSLETKLRDKMTEMDKGNIWGSEEALSDEIREKKCSIL